MPKTKVIYISRNKDALKEGIVTKTVAGHDPAATIISAFLSDYTDYDELFPADKCLQLLDKYEQSGEKLDWIIDSNNCYCTAIMNYVLIEGLYVHHKVILEIAEFRKILLAYKEKVLDSGKTYTKETGPVFEFEYIVINDDADRMYCEIAQCENIELTGDDITRCSEYIKKQ